jgi:glycosyltransferase involved in cell wall biosynthesis
VGEPPTSEVLSGLSNRPIAGKVKVLGLKGGAELAALYRNAKLLIVSSDEEGLGIVILEAMACGIPVVSTRCGGPETAVVDGVTGFLTPPGDVAALSDSTLRLLGDPELRKRFGRAGVDRVREFFSAEVVGKTFVNLYEGILAPR